ncbi:MAG: hypothetical protein AB1547_01555 [Thermodesulfobacteriota bacterium]|uniref:Uncharacterized protein n=1 Tax=Desulfatirhabdium butyrativorans TaxID=340467 RepID=A0A7C4RGI0_9BACT
MTTIMPEGEELRKAAKWIAEQRRDNPGKSLREIIAEACIKFDLSPMAAEYLDQSIERNG